MILILIDSPCKFTEVPLDAADSAKLVSAKERSGLPWKEFILSATGSDICDPIGMMR